MIVLYLDDGVEIVKHNYERLNKLMLQGSYFDEHSWHFSETIVSLTKYASLLLESTLTVWIKDSGIQKKNAWTNTDIGIYYDAVELLNGICSKKHLRNNVKHGARV